MPTGQAVPPACRNLRSYVRSEWGDELYNHSHLQLPGLTDLVLVGHGGFSRVYKAHQAQFARDVAVKVLDMDLVDERTRRKFIRECQATGRLGTHPNIVSVYEAAVTPETNPYIVMEFCAQGSLAAKLAKSGPLAPASILDIGSRISGALKAAHEIGILHRDVKPANILVTGYGHPALADFGISTSTDSSRSLGTESLTVDYAPPEVLEGQEPDARSDLYSLGVTLYTLLTGKPPYSNGPAGSVAQHLLRILRDPVPVVTRPEVPDGLRDLLRALMDKNPEHRPANAADLEERFHELSPQLLRSDAPTVARSTLPKSSDLRPPVVQPAPANNETTRRRAPRPRPEAVLPTKPPIDMQPVETTSNKTHKKSWLPVIFLLVTSLILFLVGLLRPALLFIYASILGIAVVLLYLLAAFISNRSSGKAQR